MPASLDRATVVAGAIGTAIAILIVVVAAMVIGSDPAPSVERVDPATTVPSTAPSVVAVRGSSDDAAVDEDTTTSTSPEEVVNEAPASPVSPSPGPAPTMATVPPTTTASTTAPATTAPPTTA